MALSSSRTYGGTGALRLRLDILDGRALQRTLPVPPVHRPNRGDNLPCSVFPFPTSKFAQPNERQGICAIRSRAAGSDLPCWQGVTGGISFPRTRVACGESSVEPNGAMKARVGVAEEICHENSSEELASCGRPVIFIHNGAPAGAGWLLSLRRLAANSSGRPNERLRSAAPAAKGGDEFLRF